MAEAACAGDAYALDVITETAGRLGWAVANAVTLVQPERFAIGGGVALMGDVLFEPLRKTVEQLVFPPYRGTCVIGPAELGEDAVPVGALLLAPAV